MNSRRPALEEEAPVRVTRAFVWFAAHVMVRKMGRDAQEAAAAAARRSANAGDRHEAARWEAIAAAIGLIAGLPGSAHREETCQPIASALA